MAGTNIIAGSVVWNLDVDDKKFAASLKRAQAQVDSFAASLKKVNTNPFKGIEQSSKGAAGAISQNLNTAVKRSTISMTQMTGAVALGQATYDAMVSSLSRASQFLNTSVDAANRYQSSLLGLNAIAGAFGANQDKATEAAQRLASDGLMTVAEAAAGLKNLLASRFSLEESIALMERFKDAAAFNRQAALSFGQAVVTATEGIKNGNSILVDNAGVTKNLSVILEEAGKSQMDVMNVTSDASVRQALYNGILKETQPMLGNAAQLTEIYAGTQARAAAQVEVFKQGVGGVVQIISGGLIQSFTQLIGEHQRVIISLGGAAAAMLGLAGATYAVARALQIFSLRSLVAAATNPLVAALTALSVLMGVVVYRAMDRLQQKAEDNNKSMLEGAKVMGSAIPEGTSKASKALAKMAEKLSDLDDQIEKTKRDFREQLAEMIKSHEEKAKQLQAQLDDERKAFDQSNDERVKDFQERQMIESKSHQDKVDRIKRQIKDLEMQGKLADQRELASLRNALAVENHEYAVQQQLRRAQYDEDLAKVREVHLAKTTDLQAQLDEENTLLQKHADDVASIRNVQLLDEIDKLKRSHAEQLVSYDKQKAQIIKNAGDTSAGIINAFNSQMAGASDVGHSLGAAMGNAFKEALKQSVIDIGRALKNELGKLNEKLKSAGSKISDVFNAVSDWGDKVSGKDPGWKTFEEARKSMRAAGGPVSRGRSYIVGEEGPELFMPEQSGRIISNKDLATQSAGSPASNTKVEVVINLAGIMSRSKSDERSIARHLIEVLNEELRAKGIPQIGGGALNGGMVRS